jgi:hypothetical protein
MSEHDQLRQDLAKWLAQLQERVQRLLAPDSEAEPAQRFQELLDMSQRFLELSKIFLELGKQASRAAESMMPPDQKTALPPANGSSGKG